MPLVSVVVPVHNAERHLGECLDSIRRQTLTDIEIILVDDGSTDSSPGILAEFAASDPRAIVLRGPAQGSAGAARNLGLDSATGDYLSFLDADDCFAPTLLAELHRKAVADDADIALSKFQLYHEGSGDYSPADWSLRLEFLPRRRPFAPQEIPDQLFFSVNPAAWNKLFRTSFVRAKGLRFQPLRRTNDACFTFLALARAERITYIDRALVSYRTDNSASLQGTVDRSPLEFVDALEGLREGLREAGLFDTFERGFVNQALAMCITNLKRPKTPEAFLEIYHALREDVLQRLGILGRPRGYFLRRDLSRNLAQILELSPEALLFHRLRDTTEVAEKAKADARRAAREIDMRAAAAPWFERPAANPEPAAAAGAERPPEPVDGVTSLPDVSVIVPVHNTEIFLQQCLDSVLAQPGVALELICVDDGSTDGSGRLVDDYAARDERIHVIHQANAGLSAARNAGIEAATGRYLCFLDSDDYWRIDALADLVRRADTQDLDVLMFDAVSLREEGVDDKLWDDYRDYYVRQSRDGVRTGVELLAAMKADREYRASACLYLVRRQLVTDAGLRFYPGIAYEDNLFSFGLMLQAERASHTQTALYARRVRPGSIVTTGTRAAAARGYFVTCVEMLRVINGRRFDDPVVSAALGDLIAGAFRAARNNLVTLPEDLAERLREVDPAPDAQAIQRLLMRSWREERASRILAKRLKRATGKPPRWRRHPLVVRVRPLVVRIKRLGKRILGQVGG